MTPLEGHTVLLVEDNEDDVILFKRTLKKSGIAVNFCAVEDGQRAFDYLAGTGEFGDRARYPKPALVLLDLKLPHRNGHEVLQWARSKRELDDVCFVMLTSSAEPADVEKAYALGANCYLTKAVAVETLLELWAKVTSTWASEGPRTLLPLERRERPRRPTNSSSPLPPPHAP